MFFFTDMPSGPRTLVMHYLLSLGGVVVGAGAEKFVEIRKRARRGDSVDFPIERVAYDSPYHGCHGYSEPACEHYHDEQGGG